MADDEATGEGQATEDAETDAARQAAALEAARAAHRALPRRARDALYGKLAERTDILTMLDLMSKDSAARLSSDPAFLAENDGRPIDRDPLIDHVAAVIALGAHVPDHCRVVVPDRRGAHVVALTAAERAHFGRDEASDVSPPQPPTDDA